MFDWDDQALENIIWGEGDENEDHIVPYPDERSYGEYGKKEAANVKLTEKAINDSLNGKVGSNAHYDMDNGSQTFDNEPDDREARNFVDYGWANMGSFDDLDQVLRCEDQLKYSDPDVICFKPSDPICSQVIFCSNNDLMYGNINISNEDVLWSIDPPSLRLGTLRSDSQYVETKSDFIKDENQTNDNHGEKHAQMGRQRKSLRCEEARRPRITCDPWFSLGNQGNDFERWYGHHVKISSSKHLAVPQFHSSEEHQRVPLRMTPQEKIEKLRRRQKMRAMIAIRKQQQQFRHQVLDSESMPMMIDKTTLEDTMLHQLENVIARLGIQIRLCIRDSLFRLAQSSLQRQYGGDTSGTNKSSRDENVVMEEHINGEKRLERMTDAEAKTNPIDRMVAHLLFHRPPESQSNAKLTCERTATSSDFSLQFLNESHEDNPKSSCMDGSENASNNKTADGGVVEAEASSQGTMLLFEDLQR